MPVNSRSGRLAAVAAIAALFALSANAQNGVVLTEFIFETAPHPECHASTIAETASGAMVAAWFGGTEERNRDVGIWFSRLKADRAESTSSAASASGRWTPLVEVANGVQADGSRHPTWNPVLYQPPRPGAPLLLFFKVGPSPPEWWGMVRESEDDGRTWSEARRLPEGILGPIKNKPVTLADGSLLAGSSIEDAPEPPAWRAHFERSPDLGRTWIRTGRLAGRTSDGEDFWVIQPTILTLGGGELLALFRSKQSRIAASPLRRRRSHVGADLRDRSAQPRRRHRWCDPGGRPAPPRLQPQGTDRWRLGRLPLAPERCAFERWRHLGCLADAGGPGR